jgi:hypothetical protein
MLVTGHPQKINSERLQTENILKNCNDSSRKLQWRKEKERKKKNVKG